MTTGPINPSRSSSRSSSFSSDEVQKPELDPSELEVWTKNESVVMKAVQQSFQLRQEKLLQPQMLSLSTALLEIDKRLDNLADIALRLSTLSDTSQEIKTAERAKEKDLIDKEIESFEAEMESSIQSLIQQNPDLKINHDFFSDWKLLPWIEVYKRKTSLAYMKEQFLNRVFCRILFLEKISNQINRHKRKIVSHFIDDKTRISDIIENPSYSSLTTIPDLIPFYENKVGNFSEEEIAKHLWLDPEALISDFVQKVNEVAVYLCKQGFELRGVKADGNCFCRAFLKSCETLSRIIPILDAQDNKISYLRGLIANQYRSSEQALLARAEQIEQDKEWITASGEGDLLARALEIPIRVVSVHQANDRCDINDMLTFSEKGREQQEWDTLDELERPKEYVLIVDLGGHFLCAQPLSIDKTERLLKPVIEEPKVSLQTSQYKLDLEKVTFEVIPEGSETHNRGKIPSKIVFKFEGDLSFSIFYKPREAYVDQKVLEAFDTINNRLSSTEKSLDIDLPTYKVITLMDESDFFSIWQFIDGKHVDGETANVAIKNLPAANKLYQQLLRMEPICSFLNVSDLHSKNILYTNPYQDNAQIFLIDLECIQPGNNTGLFDRIPRLQLRSLSDKELVILKEYKQQIDLLHYRFVPVPTSHFLGGLTRCDSFVELATLVLQTIKAQGYTMNIAPEELEWLVLIDFLYNDVPYLTEYRGQIYYGVPTENKILASR